MTLKKTLSLLLVMFCTMLILGCGESPELQPSPESAIKANAEGAPIQEKEPVVSVLLVGNSLMGGIEGKLSQLLTLGGYTPEIAVSNPGGYFLRQHNEHARTLDLIAQGYDLVLLQEQSGSIGRHQAPYDTLNALKAKIEAAGGEMGFYQTWAFSNRESSATENIPKGYENLGDYFDAPVLHIGRAWVMFYRTFPDRPFELFSDNVHASLHGQCLVAYVLYAYLTGESPVGVSSLQLNNADAEILQEIAWRTYQQYSR